MMDLSIPKTLFKKCVGVFLVFCFQMFSSQIYVSNETTIIGYQNVRIPISDSIAISETFLENDTKIYVMSGTTISNLEDSQIVKLESEKPDIKYSLEFNKKSVKKLADRIKKTTVKETPPVEIGYQQALDSVQFYAKNSSSLQATFTQTGSSKKVKIYCAEVFISNNYLAQIVLHRKQLFNGKSAVITRILQSSFSVRPPPFSI